MRPLTGVSAFVERALLFPRPLHEQCGQVPVRAGEEGHLLRGTTRSNSARVAANVPVLWSQIVQVAT